MNNTVSLPETPVTPVPHKIPHKTPHKIPPHKIPSQDLGAKLHPLQTHRFYKVARYLGYVKQKDTTKTGFVNDTVEMYILHRDLRRTVHGKLASLVYTADIPVIVAYHKDGPLTLKLDATSLSLLSE